jgi:DNA-binding response OmpR family regulator
MEDIGIPLPPKKILIVDDDQYLLGVYAEKFKEEGFDVTIAKDGQEAWDLIRGGYLPDVMFTGIVMPRVDGFDLIRKMQVDPKLASIPVAISSHQGREVDKAIAKSLAVDDFIIKGLVSLNEVVRRVGLIAGLQNRYIIPLARSQGDTEALIRLLDKQQLTSLGFEGEDIFLEMEPQEERGMFVVKLTDEKMEP